MLGFLILAGLALAGVLLIAWVLSLPMPRGRSAADPDKETPPPGWNGGRP